MNDNRKTLEILETVGFFSINKCYDVIQSNKENIDKHIESDVWDVKESVDYIKKICSLLKLQNHKKMVSELLFGELRYGHALLSKTLYNMLIIDTNSLEIDITLKYYLDENKQGIIKWLRVLNDSDEMGILNMFLKIKPCIRDFGKAWLGYLWGYVDIGYSKDHFLLKGKEIYMIRDETVYKINIEKDMPSNCDNNTHILNEKFWNMLGIIEIVDGPGSYYIMHGASRFIDFRDMEMMF